MDLGFSHGILRAYHEIHRRSFAKSIHKLRETQLKTLDRLLNSLKTSQKWHSLHLQSYEELSQTLPIVEDSDLMPLVLQQRQTGEPLLCAKVKRYEPTSGSTQARKWIPYSEDFLSDIHRAASAWLGDLYSQYPGIRRGRHYWSLSWLPEELRKLGVTTDDAELFPLAERLLLHRTMVGNPLINRVPTAQASWWATLLYLASAEDLTMVFVWSPTFWLQVVHDIEKNFAEIRENLNQASWGRFHDSLQPLLGKAPKRKINSQTFSLQEIWPKLSLMSAWDSSTSHHWSNQLRQAFPKVPLQGKGLWATEGVVTIPFQGLNTLAIESHFFEFRDLATGRIHPSWEVEIGGVYQPLLWTSSGFLRYALPDRVKVTGLNGETPVLEFLGRLRSTDLVGEKIGTELLEKLLQQNEKWQGLCFLAVQEPSPHYVLVHQSGGQTEGFEEFLLEHHHYRVARELQQLQPAKSMSVDGVDALLRLISKPGMVVGQGKLESVYLIDQILG